MTSDGTTAERLRPAWGGRTPARVALGLGSNVGDRLGELARAVGELASRMELEAVSSVWESRAVGYENQGDFLNAVTVGLTELAPDHVLALAHELETRAGRHRSLPDGPRTLDVDVLLWEGVTVDEPGLRIPHPRWKERSFVLAPLAEVVPGWTDPATGRTVQDLWAERRGELPPVRITASPDALLRSEP